MKHSCYLRKRAGNDILFPAQADKDKNYLMRVKRISVYVKEVLTPFKEALDNFTLN